MSEQLRNQIDLLERTAAQLPYVALDRYDAAKRAFESEFPSHDFDRALAITTKEVVQLVRKTWNRIGPQLRDLQKSSWKSERTRHHTALWSGHPQVDWIP